MILIFYNKEEPNTDNHHSKDNLYNNSGFSGSYTALIEMTNKLAEYGHDVVVYGNNETYNDGLVRYIAVDDIHLIDWDVDWFCPLFYLDDVLYHKYNILNKLTPGKTKILMWAHTFIDNYAIENYKRKFNVYMQAVSDFVKREYTFMFPENHIWTIPNCISTDIFKKDDIDINSKKGNWIFHSTFERGGNVALNIFRKVKSIDSSIANKMKIASYYTADSHKVKLQEGEEYLGSMSKKQLRDTLIKMDYYMYPLVLENTNVCHDTFGMSILEALACGVIVFVWDVACIPHLYGDLVVRINVPEHVRGSYNPYGRFGQCAWMLTEDAEKLFIDKVLELESNPERKEEIRRKGIEWSHSLTWDKYSKQMETELLKH